MKIGLYKVKALNQNKYSFKILKNTGWLLVDRVFRMGMGMIVGIQVARFLGPSDFGSISYAQALVSLFLTLVTLGLDAIVVRDISKDNTVSNSVLGSTLLLRLTTSIM
ncbi:oligosaccharide flippase family protein, partial [Priestia megaterium]|uniref:oligosaccharide flippase family protein n=1 Tax=Priestia megaterium TaxID=1404 RepID=UPI00300BBDAC